MSSFSGLVWSSLDLGLVWVLSGLSLVMRLVLVLGLGVLGCGGPRQIMNNSKNNKNNHNLEVEE